MPAVHSLFGIRDWFHGGQFSTDVGWIDKKNSSTVVCTPNATAALTLTGGRNQAVM